MRMVAALCLILLGCGCTRNPAGHHQQVGMRDFHFSPDSLEVAVGDTVTWVNQSADQHTTTSGEVGAPDGKWDSGVLSPGMEFTHVFDAAGNYHYHCEFHGPIGMKGVISVK